MLIAAHADLNSRSKDGFTAAHCAAERGHACSLAMLLGAGADASACTKDGLSVISLAADDEACRAVVEAQRHYEEDMEEDQVQARVRVPNEPKAAERQPLMDLPPV